MKNFLTAFVGLLATALCGCGPVTPGADAGRGPDGGVLNDAGLPIPAVVSTSPLNSATGVGLNASATALFSEPMNAATLTTATFTLTSGPASTSVAGSVTYAQSRAVFLPAQQLAPNTKFTATVTTGATSVAGAALGAKYVWTFTTGTTVVAESAVNLRSAGTFTILAKSAISSVPASVITGDIGVSPAAATFITGFSLNADATNVFSSTTQVSGHVYAADYAPPTPATMTASIGDMELAFTDAAGRAPNATELGAGSIGGTNLTAGVYSWGTGLLISSDVTLTGSATDVWIFQVAQNLTISNGTRITLAGGALAKNVFWQVAGRADMGTTSHAEGIFLSKTAITLATGASVTGRLFAQTAVSLDASTVVAP